MAEASAATPTSSTSKHPAIKDKECPFCHQPFTSSSLGRHLDLYIKDKNPKPPDDVHDVEEIRKLRSSITRRQARASTNKDDSTPPSANPTPIRDRRSSSIPKSLTNALNAEDGAVKTFWNQPNWQATGVINDIPQIATDDQVTVVRRQIPSRNGSVKEDVKRRQRTLDDRDRGQAAELALKEVLENIKSASARAQPSSPFEYNFFKLSLPQMYLKCLSPSPELLSEPPLLSHMAWSVSPPGTGDCEALRSWLQDRLHDWRRRRENLRFGNDVLQNGMNGHAAVHAEDGALNNEEAMYNEHLSKAFQRWRELPEKDRHENWHFECAKAYAREREQHQATSRKLEQAEQENSLLRNHLSPSNAALDAKELFQDQPNLLPLSEKSLSYLPNAPSWDFDTLLGKWKTRIRSARSTQYSLPKPWALANLDVSDHLGKSAPAQSHRADPRASSSACAQEATVDQDLQDAAGEEENVDDEAPTQKEGAKRTLQPSPREKGKSERSSRRITEKPSSARRNEDGSEMDIE